MKKKERNNKKMNTILLIVGIVLILAVIICLILKRRPTNYDITSITYSFSSSFGREVDHAKKYVIINSDGTVIFKNDYDLLVENHTISDDDYKKLHDYINERGFIFDGKVHEDNSVLDGGYSGLSIKLASGEEKKVSGYMVSDRDYKDIISKIVEIVGRDVISNYKSRVGK